MAKRERKKSESITNPDPKADVAGPSSVDYKTKKRSKMKWFIAAALLFLMIFIGGGPFFFGPLPNNASIFTSRIFKSVFCL